MAKFGGGTMTKSAYHVGVALLARREHGVEELTQKLARRFDLPTAQKAAADLAAGGILCNRRFARAYLQTAGGKFGREKLRENLAQRGVPMADIEAVLQSAIVDDECVRAAAVLRAKYGDVVLREEKSRARAARFLYSRGFLEDDIANAIVHHNRRAAADGT